MLKLPPQLVGGEEKARWCAVEHLGVVEPNTTIFLATMWLIIQATYRIILGPYQPRGTERRRFLVYAHSLPLPVALALRRRICGGFFLMSGQFLQKYKEPQGNFSRKMTE